MYKRQLKGAPTTVNVQINSVRKYDSVVRPDLQYVTITHTNSENAVALGDLVSVIDYDTTELIVARHETINSAYANSPSFGNYNATNASWFWEKGPYDVYVEGYNYHISSASSIDEANKIGIQRLRLKSNLPTKKFGFKAEIKTDFTGSNSLVAVSYTHLTLPTILLV